MAWVVIIDRSVDPADNSVHGPFADEQAGLDWLNSQDDALFEDAENAYLAPLNIAVTGATDEDKTAAVVFIEGDNGVVQDSLASLTALSQDWASNLDDWWAGNA